MSCVFLSSSSAAWCSSWWLQPTSRAGAGWLQANARVFLNSYMCVFLPDVLSGEGNLLRCVASLQSWFPVLCCACRYAGRRQVVSVATKLKKFHTVLQECGGVKLGLQVCMFDVAHLHTIKAQDAALCLHWSLDIVTTEPSIPPCMARNITIPDGKHC